MADQSDESPDDPGPRWASPGEFGEPAATDARTGVATPLLAGFSIALLAGITQSPTSFRWPGPAIFVLVLTVGLFVISLQVGFRSRGKLYSRDDALSWGRINDLPADEAEAFKAKVQRHHIEVWRQAQRTVRLSYNAGISTLGIAVSLVAAPPTANGTTTVPMAEQSWRWLAFAMGLLLTGLEIGWIARDEVIYRRLLRTATGRALREPTP